MKFSEEVKRSIVQELESGNISLREAAERAHTTSTRIKLWLEEYGRFKPKRDILEVVMKSEQDRISELEKALADAHLKLLLSEEIISLANKKYKVDLKKSFGTKQLAESGGGTQSTPSRRSLKR
jgi:transposase-like protein